MGLFRHRAKDSKLLCLELHFKALLLGLEFVGKYFCGIFITTSSLKMFLHCGMLVLFWYFSSEFGFSTGIHFGCHMEIFRTKKLFVQPTEAVEGFSLRSSHVRVISTTLARLLRLNLWSLRAQCPLLHLVWESSFSAPLAVVSFRNLLPFFFLAKRKQGKGDDSPLSYLLVEHTLYLMSLNWSYCPGFQQWPPLTELLLVSYLILGFRSWAQTLPSLNLRFLIYKLRGLFSEIFS